MKPFASDSHLFSFSLSIAIVAKEDYLNHGSFNVSQRNTAALKVT